MDKMRDEFEVWASDNGAHPRAVHRGTNEGYLLMSTHTAWEAWQASRKALVVELPEGTGWRSDPYNSGRNDGLLEATEAIRAVGIALKGEGDDPQS